MPVKVVQMPNPKSPVGLGAGGRALWRSVVEEHELSGLQVVQLTEACRMKDRCDELDRIIQGKGVLNLMRFRVQDVFSDEDSRDVRVEVKFDSAIDRANATANAMKQLLAALRLPDEAGKRPQVRGPRGAQKPSVPAGGEATKVSSMERHRERTARKSG